MCTVQPGGARTPARSAGRDKDEKRLRNSCAEFAPERYSQKVSVLVYVL